MQHPADPSTSTMRPRSPQANATAVDLRRAEEWNDLAALALARWPLVDMKWAFNRVLARVAALLARRQVQSVHGWQRLVDEPGPYLLVANHSSRREAVYLPALLMIARGGRPVHFMADWNFRLIPGAGYVYRHTGTITVTRKDARPRILNHLKPFFEQEVPPFEQARRLLLAGESVGIFPEGTVNRNAERLLRGRHGAARLSLETGVALLPVGIRFASRRNGQVDSSSAMSITIGRPLSPPALAEVATREVRDWHAELMTALAELSHKRWSGPVGRDDTASATPAL